MLSEEYHFVTRAPAIPVMVINLPAVGGSWMLPGSAIAAEDWHTVTEMAREAVNFAVELQAQSKEQS